MPALSTLIGGVSALTVLAVAIVTLTVTITFSTDALRAVARAHTESLASLANTRIEGYLLRPILATESLRKHYLSGNYSVVSADPTNATTLRDMSLVYTVYLNTRGLDEIGVYYRDGSTVLAFPHGDAGASVVANVQRGTHLETIPIVYLDNGTRAGDDVAGAFNDPIDYSFYWEPGAWLNTTVDYLSGGRTGLVLAEQPFLWVLDPETPDMYEYWGIGLTRALRNIHGSVIGVAYGGIEMSRLAAFLGSSRATPNSHVFVTDDRGFLLVGTHPAAVTNLTQVPDGTPVPGYNCYGTEGESQLVYGGPQYIGCRHHPSDYAWEPLAEYVRDNGIPKDDRVELTLLAGENYYVGVQWVRPPNTDRGNLTVFLVMPESDINGEIVRGRNIAIGVTCGVFVLAVAISFLTVYLMLTPLREVSAKMRTAAELEKDDGPRDKSSISEVRELQESFYALSDELDRLSAFVPASVLAARFAGDDDDADLAEDVPTSGITNEDTASMRSRSNRSGYSGRNSRNRGVQGSHRSGGTGKRSSSHNSGGAAVAGALNTAASLARRNVAVLFVNCGGFHRAFRGASSSEIQKRYGDFVDAMVAAVNASMGVFDHWNGDHFMVSFNAARLVNQPATKAAHAAVAIATQALPRSLQLPVAIGISTGRADVGNLGCTSAMRYCILGPVVSTASALCRWVPEYAADGTAEGGTLPAGSRVLVCNHTRSDLEMHFALRCMDYRRVTPTTGSKRIIVAEIIAPRADKNADEWLYVVGGPDVRLENQVYSLLHAGKYDDARRAVAEAKKAEKHAVAIDRAEQLLQTDEFRGGAAEGRVQATSPSAAPTVKQEEEPAPEESQASHPAAVPPAE
eukprot:CAMPEP_0174841948 /NCGR_PEP_ID=MMETSP1114-20130205/9625_1 /TAXON_ID=312471 /ORGANISM="Neobodo designis, Strain CCAP 1951/1" /LENGTH=852 /DNA_ID=CAMNT_0016076145 /DNA_START=177 /DNA_END=2735 /DNA_ORIENTATION=+